MNEKTKMEIVFLAVAASSVFSMAFAEGTNAQQSTAEAPAISPVSLPRITNTIVRLNHRPPAIVSNSPFGFPHPLPSITRIDAKPPPGLSWPEPMPSQLVVIASQPLVTGEKTLVKLAMKNGLSEKIESARAAIFLLDDQGKVVGQPTTRWVIGGSEDKPGLAPGATNFFHFVITGDKEFIATNLTTKVTFSRLVLEGGKVGDATRNILVQNTK